MAIVYDHIKLDFRCDCHEFYHKNGTTLTRPAPKNTPEKILAVFLADVYLYPSPKELFFNEQDSVNAYRFPTPFCGNIEKIKLQ